MDWINLHTSFLDSPEFLGAEPMDRATWLCLLRFCVGQENSGTIVGASTWGDRKWQQLVRVTLKEVKRLSDLWKWIDNDLVVTAYPIEKQEEIQTMRALGRTISPSKAAAAKANGALGGRPRKNPTENPTENPRGTHAEPIERNKKGKEEEGKGTEASATTADPVTDPKTLDEMDQIMAKDQATNAKVNSEPMQVSWQDWRQTRKLGIARTGEDGDMDAWRALWTRCGEEVMSKMYDAITPTLVQGKRIWYAMALDWINERYEEA